MQKISVLLAVVLSAWLLSFLGFTALQTGKAVETTPAVSSSVSSASSASRAESGVPGRSLEHRIVQGKMERFSQDGRTRVLLVSVFISLTVFWLGTIQRRVLEPSSRSQLFLAGVLVIGWLILRMVKYQVEDATVSRYLWYAFHLFLQGLPLTIFCFSLDQCAGFSHRRVKAAKLAAAALYAILLLVVFTNDLHEQVFDFPSRQIWSDNYKYNWGYYMIIGVMLTELLVSVFWMMVWGRKTMPQSVWVGIWILAIAVLLYGGLFLLGVEPVRSSDYSAVYCCAAILFLECCVRSGFVPINRKYQALFSASKLQMQLVGNDGEQCQAARQAAPLSDALLQQLRENLGQPVSFGEDTVLYAGQIRGGMVVWQENIRALKEMQRSLQKTRIRQKKINNLLLREEQAAERKAHDEARASIYESLEEMTREKTALLAQQIQELPQQQDQRAALASITLLLTYIKRRCNLFLIEKNSDVFPKGDLSVYLDELAELAGYRDMRCKNHVLLQGTTLPLQDVIRLYDLYYLMLDALCQRHVSTLLISLTAEASWSMGFSFSGDAEQYRSDPAIAALLQRVGGTMQVLDMEDSIALRVTLPKGGTAP